MKPRNFPGRKNQRRKDAIARHKGPANMAERNDYTNTQLRIVPDAVARAVRTKKDRSAFARLVRS